MFVSSSSVQNSIWGWSSNSLDMTGIGSGTVIMSRFSNLTYGNNGWAYAMPCNTLVDNCIIAIEIKDSNSDITNYQESTGQLIYANGSTRPNFTSQFNTTYSYYESKGILATDGRIYFIPNSGKNICILTPNNNPNLVTWEFFTVNVSDPSAAGVPCFFSGGVLGRDGKLYLIPKGIPILTRIDISGVVPIQENSAINNLTSPASNRWTLASLGKSVPSSTSCNSLNDISYSNQYISGQSFNSRNSVFNLFCLDPYSDKIYVLNSHGTWIMWIDPNNWNSSNALGVSNGLSLANLPGLNNLEGYRSSSIGVVVNGTTYYCQNTPYKFKSMYPGLDGKIYLSATLDQKANLSPAYSITDPNLFYHIVLDTQTDTVERLMSTQLDVASGNIGLLPNGRLLVSPLTSNNLGYTSQIETDISSIDYQKVYVEKNNESGISIRESLNTQYLPPSIGSQQVMCNSGSFITLPNEKVGKIIMSGRNNVYGAEIMSVKGFYNGVTYFDTQSTVDVSNDLNTKIFPPSNLNDLPNSSYNLYMNCGI